MKILLQSTAKLDLKRGWISYEDQEPGLGDRFQESIFDDLRSLQTLAGIHLQVHGYHRMLCKVFPFAIYYLIKDDQVIVRAIWDGRKNPRKLHRRLR